MILLSKTQTRSRLAIQNPDSESPSPLLPFLPISPLSSTLMMRSKAGVQRGSGSGVLLRQWTSESDACVYVCVRLGQVGYIAY